ncbi:Gastrulation defective protein 1 [Balamuthia mandrillaris]
MGIDGYRKQLSKKFPECWIRIQDTVPKHRGTPGARRDHSNNGTSTATAAHRFDHIYVDLNGLIHTSGRRARDEEQLVLLLFRQLDHLFKLCVPTTSVFLALDGPASAAKLITQRTRRIKSVEKQKRSAAAAATATMISITSSTIAEQSVEGKEEIEEEDSIDDEEGEVERQLPQKQEAQQTNINNYNKRRKAKQNGGFDLLQVTAGTPFMHRLKKSLCYWVCSRLQNDRKYHAIKFFVSGPDVAGEGEVKIMENISVRARQDPNFRNVQSHLIVGSDADLILMGLSSSVDNLFILTTDGQSPDFLLFSVHQFSASMQLWFPGSDCNRIKLDFMLLSLFLGNDYLPKLRCCSFESLWQRYKRLKYNPRYKAEYLFNKQDYTLNWSFLLDVFGSYGKHIRPLPKGPSPSSQRIQTNEQHIAPTNGTNTKEKNNDEEEDDEVICFRGFLPGSASVVSGDKSKANVDEEQDEAEMDEEQDEEEGENDEDDIQLEGLAYGCDPYEYMQGILWCAKMYIEGRCPDYRWYYHYRYAPTAAEIRQCFLPGHIGITQRSKSNNRRGRGRGGRVGQQQTIAMPDEEEATPVIPARELHVPSSSEPPLHPYQFCMTVLPLQAKPYVYAPLQQLMNLEESPLAYIYKPDNHSAVVDIDHIKSVVETVSLHSFTEEDKEGLFLGTHLAYARRQSRWKYVFLRIILILHLNFFLFFFFLNSYCYKEMRTRRTSSGQNHQYLKAYSLCLFHPPLPPSIARY